jgi:hypothetical protein
MRAIDQVLPAWDANEVHGVELPVPPEQALELALALPLASDPIVRTLLRMRGLGTGGTIGSAFGGMRFEELARTPTELVVGFAGRPWRPRGDVRPFADATPGTVQVAVDLRAEPAPGGSRLTTETRIAAVDVAARRAFRRYWLLVGPFSAVIRRRWLAGVARAARAQQ